MRKGHEQQLVDGQFGEIYNEAEYQAIYNEVYEKRKKEFTDRLERLRTLIEEREEHFGPYRSFF